MERPMTTVDGVVGAGVGLIGAFLLLDFTAKATKTLTQTNKSARRVQRKKNIPAPWGFRF